MDEEDGIGQSLWADILWHCRFQRVRNIAIPWRKPLPADEACIVRHPHIGRFGDETLAVASFEQRRWVVRQSDWYGWPDLDRYTLFVLDGAAVWAAKGFAQWPSAWALPPNDEAGHRMPGPAT